jgi:hypothetical protein
MLGFHSEVAGVPDATNFEVAGVLGCIDPRGIGSGRRSPERRRRLVVESFVWTLEVVFALEVVELL